MSCLFLSGVLESKCGYALLQTTCIFHIDVELKAGPPSIASFWGLNQKLPSTYTHIWWNVIYLVASHLPTQIWILPWYVAVGVVSCTILGEIQICKSENTNWGLFSKIGSLKKMLLIIYTPLEIYRYDIPIKSTFYYIPKCNIPRMLNLLLIYLH